MSREYIVATYCQPGETRRSKVQAYTLWWSPEWSGFRPYHIQASSGNEAKKLAIAMRLEDERAADGREGEHG